MKTIIEDLSIVIEEAIQLHKYWEDFKDLYTEKIDWNLNNDQLLLEINQSFMCKKTNIHLMIWKLTKLIIAIYPHIRKITIRVPVYHQVLKRRKNIKRKIWLVYKVTNYRYQQFYQKQGLKMMLIDELFIAELFAKQFAKQRRR